MKINYIIGILGVGVFSVLAYTLVIRASQTELHRAVINKKGQLVANLLSQGADYSIRDYRGKKPLEYASNDFLSEVRNKYLQNASSNFDKQHSVDPSPEWAGYLKEFKEKGIVRVSNFFTEDELNHLKSEFEGFVSFVKNNTDNKGSNSSGYTKEYYNLEDDLFISNDPFKHSLSFAKLCVDKKIMWIVNNYFQGQGYLEQAAATRLLPGGRPGEGSFQWHTDAWGKRVHVMVLLTDVDSGDQAMTYVLESNKIEHPYNIFSNSRVTLDYCKKMMGDNVEVYKATGKIGDIFVFDSNGIHSGNRTKGSTRDTLLAMYSKNKSYTWKLTIPAEIVDNKNEYDIAPFERILEAHQDHTSKDFFPQYKSWVESLPHVETWI